MTEMEIAAVSLTWLCIGRDMGIVYDGYLARNSWKDGLEFFEDITSWAEEYERKFMVPALSNKKTANELVPLLLFYVPEFMRGPARQMVGVLMGGRLRESMMYVHNSLHVLEV